MRLNKRKPRGDGRSSPSSRATVGSSGPRATDVAASRGSATVMQSQGRVNVSCARQKKRCVRSGRGGRASSGERRAGEMRRRSATRFGGKVAEGDRVATRERPRSPRAPRRTRGARSRLRGDEAPHGDSRMRAAGADARRTAARPRTARKRAIEAAGRNGRSAAEAYARRDELDQKSPTRRASGPQRSGPLAGRGELGRTAACG